MATSEVAVRERLASRVDFRGVVAVTTVLVLATMLLGVATKATGAGLACHARWPVCDGGFLNLFPRSVPSFFEWIHRVVAGVTGFAILGTVWLAWRREVPSRSRQLATLGLVLLPAQIYLGRQTVLVFTEPVLTLHFWTAFAILSSFVGASVYAWRQGLTARRLRNATAVAAGLVPIQVLIHPPVVTTSPYSLRMVQYLITGVVFATVLAGAVVGRDVVADRPGRGLVALLAVVPAFVYTARHMYAPSTWLLAAYLLFAGTLVGGLAWSALSFHRVR